LGTWSLPGVKRPGRDFNNYPPPQLALRLKEVWLYLFSTSVTS